MKIDSELGQAKLDLPVCLTSSLKAGETLKSGGFLLQISSRACDTSYRKGLDQLNSDSHRDELGCAVSLSTYSYTVIKLGCDLAAQKAEQAEEILEQYGFVDGQWPDGKELPDSTYEYAAELAAYYSSGRDSDKVEIDYLQKKNVKKPASSVAGFVVYYTNYSLIATPTLEHVKLVSEE